MAWRELTEADLAATLSQREVDAYRQSSPASGEDPVAGLLARTAEMALGYCRANRALRVPATGRAVPGSLVSACCDWAAYDVLKRQPVPVGEDRRRARDQALELFKAVAAGTVTPEPPEDGAAAAAAGSPLAAPPYPPRLLD